MDLLCNERKRVDQLNHTNCELTHCNIRYVVRRPIHSNLFSPSIADNLSCLLIHTKVRSDQNKREIEYWCAVKNCRHVHMSVMIFHNFGLVIYSKVRASNEKANLTSTTVSYCEITWTLNYTQRRRSAVAEKPRDAPYYLEFFLYSIRRSITAWNCHNCCARLCDVQMLIRNRTISAIKNLRLALWVNDACGMKKMPKTAKSRVWGRGVRYRR